MNKPKAQKRPKLRVISYYAGKQPLAEVYADVFSLLLTGDNKAKSSIRTFDCAKPFHYAKENHGKACENNGS